MQRSVSRRHILAGTVTVAASGGALSRDVIAADGGSDSSPVKSAASTQAPPLPAAPSTNTHPLPEEARAPFKSPESWDTARKAYETVFGGLSPGPAPSRFRPKAFLALKFTPLPTDIQYLPRHCDVLLQDAASLLDRGIRTRAEWRDLNTKAFLQYLEIQQLTALDAIHKDEVVQGFYTLPYDVSKEELAALAASAASSGLASAWVKGLVTSDFNATTSDDWFNAIIELNWLAHLPTWPTPVSGPQLNHTYGSHTGTAPDLARDATAITAQHDLNSQFSGLQAQKATLDGAVTAATRRTTGSQRQTDWNAQDASFRRRRTEVARQLMQAKTDAYTQPGGALNYLEQMIPVQQRFEHDFRDALARMNAIRIGLIQLYGYSAPPLQFDATSTQFDDALLWLRDAGAFLSSFTSLEQEYVFTISVHALLGEKNFKKGLSSPTSGAWSFSLDPSLFPEQKQIRIRSVSAYVVSQQDPRATWQLAIQAPQSGQVFQMHAPVSTPVEQKSPVVRLARVQNRSSAREADAVGMMSMRNVSPLGGMWKVVVADTQTPPSITAPGGGFTSSAVPLFERIGDAPLRDVQIDLRLAVRTV